MNHFSLIHPTATFTTQTDKQNRHNRSLSLLSVKLAVLSTMRQLSLFIAYSMCLRDFRDLHLLYIFVCIHYPGLRVLNYFSFDLCVEGCLGRVLSLMDKVTLSLKKGSHFLYTYYRLSKIFFLISYE